MSQLTENQKNRLRDYSWKYFEYHAQQRLRVFQLYLVLIAANITAYTALMKHTEQKSCWILGVLGALVILLSFLFYRLDKRNRELVRNGEAALKYLDEQESFQREGNKPHPLQIFAIDDDTIVHLKPGIWNAGLLTYSLFYSCLFGIIGFIGLVLLIFAVFV
ncbi:MAG: hypothetical protein MI749_05710 [Desulfovibrionales bacterium]|nr:hypothetical protein [Desulfovibrionales bacterium]